MGLGYRNTPFHLFLRIDKRVSGQPSRNRPGNYSYTILVSGTETEKVVILVTFSYFLMYHTGSLFAESNGYGNSVFFVKVKSTPGYIKVEGKEGTIYLYVTPHIFQ